MSKIIDGNRGDPSPADTILVGNNNNLTDRTGSSPLQTRITNNRKRSLHFVSHRLLMAEHLLILFQVSVFFSPLHIQLCIKTSACMSDLLNFSSGRAIA